jgi:hypothetical protein
MLRKYGWIDPTEHESQTFGKKSTRTLGSGATKDSFPDCFQLDLGPDIFDQGSLGSCTSNAIVSAYSFLKKKIRPLIVDFTSTTSKGSLRGQ